MPIRSRAAGIGKRPATSIVHLEVPVRYENTWRTAHFFGFGSTNIFFGFGFGFGSLYWYFDHKFFKKGASHCFYMCSGICKTEKKSFRTRNVRYFLIQVFDLRFFTNFVFLQQCLHLNPNPNFYFGFDSSQNISVSKAWSSRNLHALDTVLQVFAGMSIAKSTKSLGTWVFSQTGRLLKWLPVLLISRYILKMYRY
jgi:hypothetical protein